MELETKASHDSLKTHPNLLEEFKGRKNLEQSRQQLIGQFKERLVGNWFVTSRGCSIAVELMTRNQEVMGSDRTSSLSFYSFYLLNYGYFNVALEKGLHTYFCILK